MKELHEKLLKEINGQSTDDIESLSPQKFAEKTKQLHDLSLITDRYSEVESLIRDLQSLQQMLDDPLTMQDKDLLEMTKEEIKTTTESITEKEKELLLSMLPTDTADEANAILEIRAGTGGDEAGLFAADVLRMYERFAERQRWKWEEIAKTHDGLGAIKDATIAITGSNVFGQLKFESGVHRVQRVPATETQGRIHTSTVTVAIMPQPTEVQVQIQDSDVRVDVFRASGSGGQKVNTTDSAIRLTHIPTGIVIAIQDERSNQKNRAKAFTILRAKLYELERGKLAMERRDTRRKQVGSGTRSEKIRTYNFPQNRVTDHRINKTLHELEGMLDGESLPEFIQALKIEEQTDLLMAMNEEES
ncbi:peptide chain release factor RF-1 [Gamsiella multidivaricata]|uniref:peptide chain release factor RF-1 n=1 Tax=Gamsiella multidivaricata TaxID=101098 RepID=UPI0022206E4D|nr:peptide chain release factor RF-1 [Gamsiella multidivaricata]KAI7829466.1 peptide chain release factor RF-1 [Gamsiella multidivaricata]